MKKSSSGRNDDPVEMSVENHVTRNRSVLRSLGNHVAHGPEHPFAYHYSNLNRQ
jgi:hypothetical protein